MQQKMKDVVPFSYEKQNATKDKNIAPFSYGSKKQQPMKIVALFSYGKQNATTNEICCTVNQLRKTKYNNRNQLWKRKCNNRWKMLHHSFKETKMQQQPIYGNQSRIVYMI